jgi:polyisoprenoid-binding protein YceI
MLMRKTFLSTALLVLAGVSAGAAPVRAADSFDIDPVHSGVTFKISHLGLSYVFGRFKDVSGTFTIDRNDPSKSSCMLTIKTDSIDTDNKQRDDHLRSPDFFDVKQYPVITFKSTSVKAVDGGYQVTGDFTLHGVTKPLTLTLLGGKSAEFPKGVQRTGFSTDVTIKRSEHGMDKFKEALGDDVIISIGIEGTKK